LRLPIASDDVGSSSTPDAVAEESV
jgi:hypothetical protein